MKSYRFVRTYLPSIGTWDEWRVPVDPEEAISGLPWRVVAMAAAEVAPTEQMAIAMYHRVLRQVSK